MKRKIKRILNLGDFSGKIEEQLLLYMDSPGTKGSATAERLLLVGLGSSQESDRARLLDALRSSGGFIAQTAKKIKANDLMVVLPDYLEKIPANGAEQIIEGILLGDYQFISTKKEFISYRAADSISATETRIRPINSDVEK